MGNLDKLYHFLSLATFAVSSFAADQITPAQQLIRQMSKANNELNYEGIFIYRHRGQMDTMRIVHKVDENGVRERITSQTGFASEVIRDKHSVTFILPESESITVEKNTPRQFTISQLPEKISTSSDHYTFSIAGQERIANRTAWIVDILPKDDYRYGYQLWIDLESKLLLKSELQDETNVPLEQFFFTTFQIKADIPDEWLKPTISNIGYTWHDGSSQDVLVGYQEDSTWKATWMPDGFTMSNRGKQKGLVEDRVPFEHLVYSDGLAMVSVFVEKLDQAWGNVVTGAFSMGGVHAFSMTTGSYLITAVGEVPSHTVKLLAKSVTANQ